MAVGFLIGAKLTEPADLPEVRFDAARAIPVFPRPEVKHAVLIPVQDGFPNHIRPEWDETGNNPQVFLGSYYVILNAQGAVRYGSAQIQWEGMHTSLPIASVFPGAPETAWVKTAVPLGYHVTEACQLITLIPGLDGNFVESSRTLTLGTLVLKQPGGEFQSVRPEDEHAAYFSDEEALELGLHNMSSSEFADWAIAQATAAMQRI